jgi:hypothetical protein
MAAATFTVAVVIKIAVFQFVVSRIKCAGKHGSVSIQVLAGLAVNIVGIAFLISVKKHFKKQSVIIIRMLRLLVIAGLIKLLKLQPDFMEQDQ